MEVKVLFLQLSEKINDMEMSVYMASVFAIKSDSSWGLMGSILVADCSCFSITSKNICHLFRHNRFIEEYRPALESSI